MIYLRFNSLMKSLARMKNSLTTNIMRELSVGDTGLEHTVNSPQKTALSEKGAAESGAVGVRNEPIDSDLELIIEVWPTLSEASKAEVITIFKAVERSP